jgi:hypothetical protein
MRDYETVDNAICQDYYRHLSKIEEQFISYNESTPLQKVNETGFFALVVYSGHFDH